ncbi:MAG: Outer membrane vitamin B12 receptor BtuB, partial [uncultured Gemmatimonadaceae bacterium]
AAGGALPAHRDREQPHRRELLREARLQPARAHPPAAPR